MQEIPLKQFNIKISALGLALITTLMLPVGTAGVTGGYEVVPVTQTALAALPITSGNDIRIIKATEYTAEAAVISDIFPHTAKFSQN